MGLALAAAGATKLSALAPSAVLVLAAAFLLASRGAQRARQWLAIAALSASLPGLWLVRHRLLLPGVSAHPTGAPRFDLDIVSYLTRYPVLDHTFKNFVGLIGWTGTGHGDLRWFQSTDPSGVPPSPGRGGLTAARPSPRAEHRRAARVLGWRFRRSFRRLLLRVSWRIWQAGLVKRFVYSLSCR
jgi:hypothetical protein